MNKSRVLTLGLACFFTAVTACSTLAATSGGGALYSHLNDVSHASSPYSQEGPQEVQNNANNAQNGALNLDPKTDETIYTTESGIEIKSHNVTGQTVGNSQVQYFSLGSYNGTPVNWIILASGSKLVESITPAGIAINADTSQAKCSFLVEDKLLFRELLVISEKVFEISSYQLEVNILAETRSNAPGSYFYGNGHEVAPSLGVALLDTKDDFVTDTKNTALIRAVNEFITGDSLGLSFLLDTQIIVNSNFGDTYGLVLNYEQINQYLPLSMINAQNLIGEITPYSVADLTFSCEYNVSYARVSDYYGSEYATGSGTCTIYGNYIDNNSLLIDASAVITGRLSQGSQHITNGNNKNDRIYSADCSYSLTNKLASTMNYVRPAFVLKI